jgi:two-component system response regulator VicR
MTIGPGRDTFRPSTLTTGQAARHCQVSVAAIRRWIQQGRLAAFRTPGRHCRIAEREFERFLRQHGMPPYGVQSRETRILIVDDEPSLVKLLVDVLSADPRGLTLDTATDGYEALIKVGAFRPTLLILDVLMPGIDGVEVCRRLKADNQGQALKILGITAHPAAIPALIEAGADLCLAKPIDLASIEQAIDRLLGPREM